jgi:uncharacterized protein DUF397
MSDRRPPDLQFRGWRKSSYSQANGNSDCVEVGRTNMRVGVRDTKNRRVGTLIFPADAWTAFLAQAR